MISLHAKKRIEFLLTKTKTKIALLGNDEIYF